MPPSRRLQAGALLFGGVVMSSLLLAPLLATGLSWEWTLAAAVFTVALGWRPIGTILFQRGPGAVRRFEWAAEGQWRLDDPRDRDTPVRLARETAGFGPWLLLVWHDVRRRRYALIDARDVGPEVFRSLRGRLRMRSGRPPSR